MKSSTKIIAGVSFFVALCAWGFVGGEINNILSRIASVNNLQQQITSAQSVAATTASLRKTFLGIGEDSHIFDSYFVSATDTPTFIGNIETLAQANNLNVSIASVNISSQGSEKELNITLSVIGSWTNTVNFIHLLELLPYGVTLGQVDLTSSNSSGLHVSGGNSEATSWRADIQLGIAAD